MLFSLYLLGAAAIQGVSAGVLNRRAPLSAAKLLDELSSLNGRDFCFNYINAQVLVLPDYKTVYVTKTISKVVNTKSTTTTTETIGTLRKGTTTEYVYTGTVNEGTTIDFGSTIYTRVTITSTVLTSTTTVTITGYPTPGLGLRKRQVSDPLMPEAIADSDPISISAACTKVINKYPIMQTEAMNKTLSATTTATSTSTSIVVKVQKATQIDPYATRTVTTVTTVIGGSTVHLSSHYWVTHTTVVPIAGTTITTLVPPASTPITTETTEEPSTTSTPNPYPNWTPTTCFSETMPSATMILHPYVVSSHVRAQWFENIQGSLTRVECCSRCGLSSAVAQSCLAWTWLPFGQFNEADEQLGYCTLHVEAKTYYCRADTIGIAFPRPGSVQDANVEFRQGECGYYVEECHDGSGDECKSA